MKNKLEILYEDNHIIVVVKPVNILSQSDSTKDIDMLTMVKSYIKEKYNKPGNVYVGLVHRLDRPTGGIMVFAKTSKAASRLSKDIANHNFKKEYLAVIEGNLVNRGILENYLDRDGKKAFVTTKEKGKYSKLDYEVISKKEKLNLVKVNLTTGRHHQIRIQFSNIGFPLYGDQLYGKNDKEQIALYAYHLVFTHPTTKEIMNFKIIPKYGVFKEFNTSEVV